MAALRKHLGGYLVVAMFVSLYLCYVQETGLTIQILDLDQLKSFSQPNNNQKCYNHTIMETHHERIFHEKKFPCNITSRPHYGQRGIFWVLYNYVTAKTRPACDESITYTTHSDYTFLDNLVPLVERWRGPVSISVYAPGTDFEEALQRIQYLVHVPRHGFSQFTVKNVMDCSKPIFPFENVTTFKSQNGLLYPINVTRNIAREMAPTHYILSSDIELYPSPDLIPRFFDTIHRDELELLGVDPKVFVLPIFEVDASVSLDELPRDKRQLQKMLWKNKVITFHKFVCEQCHLVPNQLAWIQEIFLDGDHLKVFHVGKRLYEFEHWEPIYIGTKEDPFYDERLTWDDKKDKMTQAYILCVLDYEFHILNNAFLIHRPGIKKNFLNVTSAIAEAQNFVINQTILPELNILYFSRKGCVLN